VARNVFDQVKAKVEVGFEDLGEQEVKNIPEPIRVYRWTNASADPMPGTLGTLPLPDKPSIVVLPFDDISGDAGDPYFADGVTEDIITELSRFSNLFVIARNSAFTYKGRAVKAQEIRRDLGVRYIVEGSVRRSGGRVRVTVQLINSETGSHVWADRYDRELGDIFDLQDELTQAIVATLPGRLLVAEEKRIRRKPPQQMAAYDYVLAGRIHHHRVTSEDNAEALRMLETAIQLDPGFAEAYAWKACTLGQALQFGFCTDFAKTEEEAFAAIDKALSLDENDVECHRLLCEVRMESRRFDQAETHSELALAMNPNDPRIVAQRGELLTWLGRPDEGVEWIEKAMRVDPFGAPGRAHLLGRAFYTARRYAEAIDAFKKIVSPSYMHLAEVAACHARIGDQVCANESAVAALRLNPDFSVDQYMRTRTYQNPADAAHLAEGMREAGLPA
jgi:adenylate cyclase